VAWSAGVEGLVDEWASHAPCIDLNSDLGESYGHWQLGDDAALTSRAAATRCWPAWSAPTSTCSPSARRVQASELQAAEVESDDVVTWASIRWAW